jgi:hypothetical protein
MFVPASSVFARATGPQNAAVITGAYAGEITITGPGVGGDATAVAVLGDLVAIARDRAAIVPAPVLKEPAEIKGLTDDTLASASGQPERGRARRSEWGRSPTSIKEAV